MPDPKKILKGIWQLGGMPETALDYADLHDTDEIFPSSFNVGLAAQCSIASAALAAAEVWHRRTGQSQRISVALDKAELECTGYFTIDGETPNAWAKISGLYPCKEGHVRIHANFDHHRDGVLKILDLPTGDKTEKAMVQSELADWRAEDLEETAAEKGLVVASVRSFEEWDRHPQSLAVAELPLLTMEKIAESDPVPLTAISSESQPLTGIRVLDLTRILAGPVCGRTLAAYGADVMLLNSPRLPNIESIIDTSRGKLSALVDLETEDGKRQLHNLIADADVLVQGYRPGGLDSLGFGAEELAANHPGLIYVSLSAYSHEGPWSGRRGFDSLVQTATGFNHAEAVAAGSETPKPMPVQILDYASGFLMAYAAQAAMLKRATEGGSWHIRISLLQTAVWLRNLGRKEFGDASPGRRLKDALKTYPSGYGELRSMPHAAEFSSTRVGWSRPSVEPGTDQAVWPER